MMFLRILLFAFLFGCLSVNGVVPVPPAYQQAESALKRYTLNPMYNPIVHSLLNVYIHDKRGRAFISDEAIEMALLHVKELDENMKSNNEKTLREFVSGINCRRHGKNCVPSHRQKINRLTPDVKQKIVVALDHFFENANLEDEWPLTGNNENKAPV